MAMSAADYLSTYGRGQPYPPNVPVAAPPMNISLQYPNVSPYAGGANEGGASLALRGYPTLRRPTTDDTPPPAEQAAKDAAAKTAKANAAPFEDPANSQGQGNMPTPPVNYGTDNVASIAAGGAPRQLNYGPNNTIIGSGSGSKGQFNTFTGVGTNPTPTLSGAPVPYDTTPTGFAAAQAAPAARRGSYVSDAGGSVNNDGSITPGGGAGNLFAGDGGRTSANPGLDAIRAQIADLHSQGAAYQADGTLKGRVLATAMYRRAAALGTQLGAEGTLAHGLATNNLGLQQLLSNQLIHQGQLGLGYSQLGQLAANQGGILSLDRQKAGPIISAQLAAQKHFAETGDLQGAYQIMAGLVHGANPNPISVTPTVAGSLIAHDASGTFTGGVDINNQPFSYPNATPPLYTPPKKP